MIIEDFEHLGRLREEWGELWERCAAATPFQSPDWLIPWWRAFAPGRLWCLALRRAGRLALLAPLYVDKLGTVRILGAGNTDYLDVLVEPGVAVTTIYDHALAGGIVAEFQDLRSASPLLRSLPPGTEIRAGEVCPVVKLPPSAEEWKHRLAGSMRRNLNRYRKKLEAEQGPIHCFTSNKPDGLEPLFRLHDQRWRELRGSSGVLAHGKLRSFHREVAAGFARNGWLRLHCVEVGGRVAAIMYAFVSRRRLYLYLSGFDPSLARYGPGNFAIEYAIEAAIREGLTEVDFLRGAEPYKYSWGAVDRRNSVLMLRSTTTQAVPLCRLAS